MVVNTAGVRCPDCGWKCHRAEFEGTVRDRCTMNLCDREWFDPEEVEPWSESRPRRLRGEYR